ncbi:MAG TPA: hypothetical protein VHP34_01890 [Alphaproteobacteria bacterium]|nr:hypothetical protein [Alphaproteobacteria bacterium]
MTLSNNPAADSKEVGDRLKQVADYVKDCDRRVNRGEIMDLQGLDKTVREICDAMAQLPEDEVEKHESAMSALIKDLETLAKSMKAQQEMEDGEA